MDVLTELQEWYHAQCDGDWEHSWGIKIGTLDNPGWTLDINLRATALAGVVFKECSYGVGTDAAQSGDEWLVCKVRDDVFQGRGGPFKLREMIEVFLEWAKKNS
jgi:hypothetical protein